MDAVVYWIRAPHHTDMMSEGYVGVTTQWKRRLESHLRDTYDGCHHSPLLMRNVKKYGYMASILIEGAEEYCYLVEEALRPKRNIGWNHSIGGRNSLMRAGQSRIDVYGKTWYPMKGKNHSEETKRKMSASMTGIKKTPEQRASISRAKKGTNLGNTNVSGKKWWNDGSKSTMAFEQPSPNHVPGRLKF